MQNMITIYIYAFIDENLDTTDGGNLLNTGNLGGTFKASPLPIMKNLKSKLV